MITRREAVAIGFWVVAPLLLFLLLLLINPVYEQGMFERFGGASGLSFVLFLVVLHGLILMAGLYFLKLPKPADSAAPRPCRPRLLILLFVLTMLFCTLPSMWLVVFYPSMMRVLQTPAF